MAGIAYKMFRVSKSHPGEIFPLFVLADRPTPIGEWAKAECGVLTLDHHIEPMPRDGGPINLMAYGFAER